MIFLCAIFFVLFPFTSLVLNVPMLLANSKSKYRIIYIVMIAFSLSIIGFHLIPIEALDGFRHKSKMITMNNMTYFQTYDFFNEFKVNPVIYTFWYLIAQTGIYQLAPAISVFFTYIILLYIYFDYSQRINAKTSGTIFVFLLLFSWLSLISIISGMRFNIAFTISALGFYREFIQKKRFVISFLFYITAFLVHTSMFGVVLIRLIMFIYHGRVPKVVINFIFLTWSLYESLLPSIINFLPGFIADTMTLRLNNYSESYEVTNHNALIYLFLRYLYCFVMILIVSYLNNSRIILKEEKELNIFVKLLAMFAIGGFFNDIFMVRFSTILMVIAPIVVLRFILSIKNANTRLFGFGIIVLFSSFGFYEQVKFSFAGLSLDISLWDLFSDNVISIFLK